MPPRLVGLVGDCRSYPQALIGDSRPIETQQQLDAVAAVRQASRPPDCSVIPGFRPADRGEGQPWPPLPWPQHYCVRALGT